MKLTNILFILGICLIISSCQSCDEIGPSISISKTDRIVVIEEFTGVRCVNCPQGSAEIEALLNTYGDNLIAVSIHGGIFSDPYDSSKYDFRTDDGTELIKYLNAPSTGPAGYPAAVINRKLHNGSGQDRAVFQSSWAGIISSELQAQADVRVTINKSYDPTTRLLTIKPEIFFLEDISGDVNITAMITQDSIVDYQLDQVGKVPNYVHKHVLRDVITNTYSGDLVGTDMTEGTLSTFNYTYTLPNEWKAEKCHVIVFANRNNGSTIDILQAAEVYVENQ